MGMSTTQSSAEYYACRAEKNIKSQLLHCGVYVDSEDDYVPHDKALTEFRLSVRMELVWRDILRVENISVISYHSPRRSSKVLMPSPRVGKAQKGTEGDRLRIYIKNIIFRSSFGGIPRRL
jgi:hypothetical protein